MVTFKLSSCKAQFESEVEQILSYKIYQSEPPQLPLIPSADLPRSYWTYLLFPSGYVYPVHTVKNTSHCAKWEKQPSNDPPTVRFYL